MRKQRLRQISPGTLIKLIGYLFPITGMIARHLINIFKPLRMRSTMIILDYSLSLALRKRWEKPRGLWQLVFLNIVLAAILYHVVLRGGQEGLVAPFTQRATRGSGTDQLRLGGDAVLLMAANSNTLCLVLLLDLRRWWHIHRFIKRAL